MALIFARVPLAKAAALVVLIWGIVCILTVVCHNYGGFVAQRFFLGLMESAVSPAFVAVTALWYKPQEQATRLGIWYSATGVSSVPLSPECAERADLLHDIRCDQLWSWPHQHGAPVEGLVGATFLCQNHADLGRYYFCGSVTIAWSLAIFFLMPSSPLDPGRFFNEAECEILVRRFQENPFGKDKQPFRLDQFIEALLDIKTWIYFLMAASIYVSRSRSIDTCTLLTGTDLQRLGHCVRREDHQRLWLQVSSLTCPHKAWLTSSARCRAPLFSFPAVP
jgi:MFS family permease